MSEKNQDKCPAESTPPPYASTVPQGQQYEQYPQGYSQTNEYTQLQPPQGYSHGTGYQPVAQGYEQQGFPQTQHYGQQPMYGGQGPYVVSNRAAHSGNMRSAEQSARTARNLTILSVVLGLIWVVIIIVLRDEVLPTSGYTHYT